MPIPFARCLDPAGRTLLTSDGRRLLARADADDCECAFPPIDAPLNINAGALLKAQVQQINASCGERVWRDRTRVVTGISNISCTFTPSTGVSFGGEMPGTMTRGVTLDRLQVGYYARLMATHGWCLYNTCPSYGCACENHSSPSFGYPACPSPYLCNIPRSRKAACLQGPFVNDRVGTNCHINASPRPTSPAGAIVCTAPISGAPPAALRNGPYGQAIRRLRITGNATCATYVNRTWTCTDDEGCHVKERTRARSHVQVAVGWEDATSKISSGGALHYRIAAVFTPATDTLIDYLCGPVCADWPPWLIQCDCDADWCTDISSTGPATVLPSFVISVWE